MTSDRYRPSVITAAVTGGDVLPSQSPHIPRGADHIAREAIAAARAGATCVHLHARTEDGRPSADPALFEDIVSRVREATDVVVNITTGGAPGMSIDERLAGIAAARPELATFNLGTMNYEGFPTRSRWPEVGSDWEREVLEGSGDGTFINTLATLRHVAATLKDLQVTPELEAYDLGHVSMARFLIDEGTLQSPVRLQLVLGVIGGAGNDLDDLIALRDRARRILSDDLADLGVAATGYPSQFRHAAFALAVGMDTRVGLEDSLRIDRGTLAQSNAEMVKVATELAAHVGRPVATPDELRGRLTPWR